MIQLDKTDFNKLIKPIGSVNINNLFARSVVENHVTGSIYVDHKELPETYYIVHPYGMSLLFGNTENDDFNSWLLDYLLNTFGNRSKVEWLQAFPGSWNKKLAVLLGDKLVTSMNNAGNRMDNPVEENTRVNFKFNNRKYLDFKQLIGNCEGNIVPTDIELFEKIQGSVVPQYFWNCAKDFHEKGVGFSMIIGDKPVSTAYSAYITDNMLEIGIETVASYRGKGLAKYTCAALIDYCLNNSYEPVWSCRLENTGSYNLALKLGFEPTVTLPYYKLPV